MSDILQWLMIASLGFTVYKTTDLLKKAIDELEAKIDKKQDKP